MAGRPLGAINKDKPFVEALRMEINEAGENHKRLRLIARKLLSKAEDGDLQAIQQVADRLDGKPAQESTVTIDDKRDATDWGRAELVEILNDARASSAGTAETEGRGGKPDRVH